MATIDNANIGGGGRGRGGEEGEEEKPPASLSTMPEVLVQGILLNLDALSLSKARSSSKMMRREGREVAARVVNYLKDEYYGSRFVHLPELGEEAGQVTHNEMMWRMTRDDRQEVLIMGNRVGGFGSTSVHKMIIEHENIRFEDSTPMLLPRFNQATVYHQGEVFSISTGYSHEASKGTMERLDTLSQTRTMLQSNLPRPLFDTSGAILNNKLFVIGGEYRDASNNDHTCHPYNNKHKPSL